MGVGVWWLLLLVGRCAVVDGWSVVWWSVVWWSAIWLGWFVFVFVFVF